MNKIKINDKEYLLANEIIRELKISRQTLWRWRQEGKIPKGRKYRNKILIYTLEEFEFIKKFAYRIIELEDVIPFQLKLFKF